MALDGIMLAKIIPGIQAALPARIQKIYQISNTEILFQIHGKTGKQQLLISCHSNYNRILLTQRSYPTPDAPGNFIMVLRKYLDGATMTSIQQAELDRWCQIAITHHNSIGDLENLTLYIELMGKYANVILVNQENRIIDALHRIPPFQNSNRTIEPGAQFQPVPPQQKENPFADTYIDPEMSLTQQFSGFSPFLTNEVEYRLAHGETFPAIMKEIEQSDQLYLANQNNTIVFHCIPLTSIPGPQVSYPIYVALDLIYYHAEEKDRIRQITGDIYAFCKKERKHQVIKLPRLEKEYEAAQNCDRYRQYGELLYTYNITDTKGQSQITLQSYETGQNIQIPLDPKLDGKANARKHFQKYDKLKKGQVYLKEQIDICTTELEYFDGLLEQLDQADFASAKEIRQELINEGYLHENRRSSKKKKTEAPHVTNCLSPTGIPITFGRNNLQNETVTWHMAKKNEIWLHAKDYHGAHVLIHSSEPDEETMRFAANIAAYFSGGRHSSSVPVIYCRVKNLKKIPGAKPGKVQLGSYKMIYIDPEADELIQNGIEL